MMGVSVADIFNQPAQNCFILGQFTARDIAADQITENPAEVFVARVRHERSGIGQHADEAREQPDNWRAR